MKKIILSLALLLALIVTLVNYVFIPKAQSNIQDYFASAGFKDAVIEKAEVHLNGLYIPKVTLDKDGFNIAQDIKATLSWPSYIFTGSINNINIDTLKASSVVNAPKDLLRYKRFFSAERIENLTKQNLHIKNIIWDIAAQNNAIRIEGNLKLSHDDGTQKISANLGAKQHELSFQSQWSGQITDEGKLNLEGLYDNFDIHTNGLKLKRGTGWVSYETTGKTPKLTAQLDAGNGALINIPVSNISLILDQKQDSYPLLMRASASGIDDVNLYSDFNFAQEIKDQSSEFLLEIKNPNKFVNYLRQQNVIKNTTSSTDRHSTENTNIYLTYESENRFADGPFPFSINIKENEDNKLNGTFLVYPNNLDVRGTAQGDKEMISLLQSLFSFNEENVTPTNIRFDNNLKDFL